MDGDLFVGSSRKTVDILQYCLEDYSNRTSFSDQGSVMSLSTPLPLDPTSRSESSITSRHQRFTLCHSNNSRHHGGHDIHQVPTEMPMCLLAEDEEATSPPLSLAALSDRTARDMCSDGPSPVRSIHHTRVCSPDDSPPFIISQGRHQSGMNERTRHGGGWPKGRSRKKPGALSPPKLPVTGYGIFVSENKLYVQQQCGTKSMPVLSQRLGKMWSELSLEEKNVFYDRARSDQVRYLDELRKYLSYCYKGINMEKANGIISKSFDGETDDKVLACNLCELCFTSLYSKRSHYCGKLHLQTLLQQLNKVRDANDEKNGQYPALVKVLPSNCEVCSRYTSFWNAKFKNEVELYATSQQLLREAEYFRLIYGEILTDLKTQEKCMKHKMLKLLQLIDFSDHESD